MIKSTVEIEGIHPPLPPFSLDAKIFCYPGDDDDENFPESKDYYSLNDWENSILAISGVSEKLMGKKSAKKKEKRN